MQPLLRPAAWLYGLGQSIRRYLYRQGVAASVTVNRPVIAVGSLVAGGAGKTPFSAYLLECLSDRCVALLSRGYLGHYHGVRLVQPNGDPSEVGDEPICLARRTGADIWVARNRARLAAQLAERYELLVLDDGFQHLRLRRDLNICMVTPESPGSLLPAGMWREEPAAVRDADFVVALDQIPDWLSSYYDGPTAVITLVPGAWQSDSGSQEPPESVFAFCGIARPERFDQSLVDLRLTGTWHFADHHGFTPAELEQLWSRATASGADALVTTAKDAVRISRKPAGLPLFWRDVNVQWTGGADQFEAVLKRTVGGP
jgi:tetraacyldisaccharide 4'-kinase